jgi:hypothetical protein
MDNSIVIILIWVISAIVVFRPVFLTAIITGVDVGICTPFAVSLTIPPSGV